MNVRSISFALAVLVAFPVTAYDLTRVNFNYLYDPGSPISATFLPISGEGEQLNLFAQIAMESDFEISFFTQTSYDQRKETFLTPSRIDTLTQTELAISFQFPISELESILVLYAQGENGEEFYFPVEIDFSRLPGFYLTEEVPLTGNFARTVPGVVHPSGKQTYAYGYPGSFGLADPPFGNMQALSPSIDIDTLFAYGENAPLKDWNFYFLQEDTTTSVGIGFLKCAPYFPRYRRVEELVGPLEYLCSAKEFESIVTAPALRSAFQDFWIKVAGSEESARRAIRRYYRGVTVSNLYFTNYKPGWQTDQGMIYLIYGMPDEVVRTDRKEIWRYDNKLSFEFLKISTLLAPTLYTLIRNSEYKDSWIQRIRILRAGL